MSIGFSLTHYTMGYFAIWGAAPYPALFFEKKRGKKLLMSIGLYLTHHTMGYFVKWRKHSINFVGTGVPDGPSKQKLFEKIKQKTFNVDRVLLNTALDGLFFKIGNIRIIFVGTGVPDGPSKQKLFEKR